MAHFSYHNQNIDYLHLGLHQLMPFSVLYYLYFLTAPGPSVAEGQITLHTICSHHPTITAQIALF